MTTKTITGYFGCALHLRPLPSGALCVTAEHGEDTTCAHVTLDELRAALDEVAPGSYTRYESPDYADGGVAAALIEKEAEQTLALAQLKALGDDGTALRCAVMIAQAGAGESTVAEFCRQIVRGDDVNVAARAEDAERMAVLWKEIAREHVRRTRTARGYIEALQGGIDMERARVEKAEENVRAREEMINRLSDRAEKAEHVAQERAATIEEQAALIEHLRAEQPRALTPDAITEDLVKRAQQRARELYDDGMLYLASEWCIREVFTAALTEPRPRPEWEQVESLLREMPPGTVTQGSKWLVERGVRVVTEEDR